jgi:large subunit ribosomal protein L9
MEVILLERVEALGMMGDVVRVKDGYARNYLLPQKKALRSTKANRERFDGQRHQLEAQNLERRKDAETVAKKVDGLKVALLRQAGDTGQLYGSVNARDIAEAITAAGYTVDRRQVMLNVPIKALGGHPIKIALHPEVTVTVNVYIARSEAEAEAQTSGAPAPEVLFEEGALPLPEGEADEAASGAPPGAGD